MLNEFCDDTFGFDDSNYMNLLLIIKPASNKANINKNTFLPLSAILNQNNPYNINSRIINIHRDVELFSLDKDENLALCETQRPVQLFDQIFKFFNILELTNKNECVVDLFSGSGSGSIASLINNK